MLKPTISLFSVALALAVTPPALHAQASTPLSASSRPIYDAVTVAGAFCGLSGAGHLNQARNAAWRAGRAASVGAPGRVKHHLGVPARGGGGPGEHSRAP